jgi:hypothetical protein
VPGGEAPQFHQLATEGQGPRPEREGEEHRRGRRNRGGRDRDRNRGDRPREGRPLEEQSPAAAALAEQQRRIHELESRAEQTQHEEPRQRPEEPQPRHEEPQQQRYEPPVEQPREEPRPIEQPRVEEPRIDAKQLLNDSGLVMVETDRAKVTVQPQAVEEAQPAGRPRRERPKPPSQDDDLVQIETNRK